MAVAEARIVGEIRERFEALRKLATSHIPEESGRNQDLSASKSPSSNRAGESELLSRRIKQATIALSSISAIILRPNVTELQRSDMRRPTEPRYRPHPPARGCDAVLDEWCNANCQSSQTLVARQSCPGSDSWVKCTRARESFHCRPISAPASVDNVSKAEDRAVCPHVGQNVTESLREVKQQCMARGEQRWWPCPTEMAWPARPREDCNDKAVVRHRS